MPKTPGMEVIQVEVKPPVKVRIKKRVAGEGRSVADWLREAVDEKLKRDGGKK